MSTLSQSQPTAIDMFQARFGAPPGSQDAKADCEKWQRLCDHLLAEHKRLRADLEKARLDEFCKGFQPTLTMEEVYSQVDRETPIGELIADIEREAERQS